jgi:pantetheine-phosphate adenylyltransferase
MTQPLKTGFYAGSFDPLTNGHISVVEASAALVDRLVIGIGVHASKTPFLPLVERLELLENVRKTFKDKLDIIIVTFDVLSVQAARQHGATVLIRGLRDGTDFDYEMQLASMNAKLAPDLQTIFIPASPETRFISSTLVRQISRMQGNVDGFIPENVAQAIGKNPQP